MYTLLVGVPTDPVLQYFFQKHFVKRDKKILFVNTLRIGKDIGLTKKGWHLPCGGFLYHADVGSVYNRMLTTQSHVLEGYLNWLMDEVYDSVINRPRATLSNFSKIWQLDFAQAFGFKVPNTEVLANTTLTKQHGAYIFKSISSVRSIVHKVENHRRKSVHEPVVFQEDKGRKNIRVHVVSGQCYCQQIISQDVDYRYDLQTPRAQKVALPKALESQCVALSEALSLSFSGIDLLYQDDQYFFLEINPSPGYSYFEKQMQGSPISRCLYQALRQPCRSG